jgi:hypothetical protein
LVSLLSPSLVAESRAAREFFVAVAAGEISFSIALPDAPAKMQPDEGQLGHRMPQTVNLEEV